MFVLSGVTLRTLLLLTNCLFPCDVVLQTQLMLICVCGRYLDIWSKKLLLLKIDFWVVKLKPNYKLVSFDIVDLYTNIPTEVTLKLLKDNLRINASMSAQMIDELIDLLKVILMQNYFTFNGLFYSQDDGLAMGLSLIHI